MAALDFPDAPTNGQVYDKWTWNGSVWALTPTSSAGPRTIAYAEVVTTQTGLSTTLTDLTGLTASVTPAVGRRYKVTGHVAASQVTAPGSLNFVLASGTSTSHQSGGIPMTLASSRMTGHQEHVFVAANTTPITFKLRLATSAGAGQLEAHTQYPAFIMIEDIT